jgi:murein DD-endopeptidase MepM/ murein hydrolase activator NlpD
MKKCLSKFSKTTFFLLFFVSFFLHSSNVKGATVEELKKNIEEKNKQIESLNKEIEVIDKKIKDVNTVGQTLQSTIKVLDTSANKLETEVKVTENKISKTDLNIEKIGLEIGDKENKILSNRQAIAKTIREINYSESNSILEYVLSGTDLSDMWDNMSKVERFQNSVKEQIYELNGYKTELEKKKKETESLKNELGDLKKQLVDKKIVVDINKKEKTTLLSQTKNEEANYRKMLDEKKKLADAFSKEIFDIESQIRIAIDPLSYPKASKGILSWPVDNVKITQYYGLTEYSKRLYNSGSHNGIDFGGPTGTPIKAVAGGIVEEVGNTDAKASCAGRSYGKWILIRHNNGLSTVYGHLSLIKATNGAVVKAGDVIGYIGSTGYSTGPHLHLSLFASQGVNVGPLTSTTCGGMRIPLATPAAYLDPFPYF